MNKPKIASLSPTHMQVEEGEHYSICTCGLSETQPFCDGAHKGTDWRPYNFIAEKTEMVWLCNCKYSEKMPFCDGTHKNMREN